MVTSNGPGTLGIVGGGQLGRMLALAAARLDLRVVVLDPADEAPAAQVANRQIVAAYDDVTALAELAAGCDVVTYEFENVPADGLEALNAEGKLRPGPRALSISQDRLTEKEFVASLGLATAPYRRADSQSDLAEAVAAIAQGSGAAGVDDMAIVKTRRLGYDGKGQVRVGPDRPLADDGFDSLGGVPLIVEGFVDFACEISVIGARGLDGDIRLYDPAANTHTDGVLSSSVVPAPVSARTVAAAQAATARMLDALDYVGVMGVEFFVVGDGDGVDGGVDGGVEGGVEGTVVVNEFAPRVHNSGHWTEAACLCSQFEQHVRAVAGLPLGDPARHSDAEMENLLGDPGPRSAEMLAEGDWMVHLYGKAEARPGRKMGHATRLNR